MPTWALRQAPQMIPHKIDEHEYEAVIAGTAEIIYRAFSQLDSKKKISRPSPIGSNVRNASNISHA